MGLFVDAAADTLGATLDAVGFDLLLLHNDDSVERVSQVRERIGVDVMKAFRVAEADDIAPAGAFNCDCSRPCSSLMRSFSHLSSTSLEASGWGRLRSASIWPSRV